jgi:hypothetical protein
METIIETTPQFAPATEDIEDLPTEPAQYACFSISSRDIQLVFGWQIYHDRHKRMHR